MRKMRPSESMREASARLRGRPTIALVTGALVLVVLLALPVIATSASPGFFGRYGDLAQNHEELETSQHAGIGCRECHTDPRGPVMHSIAVIGDFYTGLVARQDAPVFLEFATPERRACLKCHETDWSHDNERTGRIPHPAHMRVSSETRECVTCHKWTGHQETYIQQHKEMPFSGVCAAYGCHVGTKNNDECVNCHHALRDEGEDWLIAHPRISQSMGARTCLESCHDAEQCRLCHTTGERPIFEGLATETGLKAIERLHVTTEWMERHGAEAISDQAACMKCHVSDGECRACHTHRPDSHEPKASWIGRHKDVVEDERRCLTCHDKQWCEECHDQFKEMR